LGTKHTFDSLLASAVGLAAKRQLQSMLHLVVFGCQTLSLCAQRGLNLSDSPEDFVLQSPGL